MNKLPLEIENEIWNMYYMDKFKNVIFEYHNLLNLRIELDTNIETIKKYFRYYRFNNSLPHMIDITNILSKIIVDINTTVENILNSPNCIKIFIFNFDIDTFRSTKTCFNFSKNYPVCHNACYYFLYLFCKNKRNINILFNILDDCKL